MQCKKGTAKQVRVGCPASDQFFGRALEKAAKWMQDTALLVSTATCCTIVGALVNGASGEGAGLQRPQTAQSTAVSARDVLGSKMKNDEVIAP